MSRKKLYKKGEKATVLYIMFEKAKLFLCVITWKSIQRKNKEIKYFKNLLNDILEKIKWI